MISDRKLIPLGQLKSQSSIFRIPLSTQELLWLSNDDPSQHVLGMNFKIMLDFESRDFVKILTNTCDPSTIFIKLPIIKPDDTNKTQKLDYYPSYLYLTPEQRWIYLKWLEDVTSKIDIGYVFLYYYGLERHLLVGRFKKAFQEILKLRKYHQNKSFLNYSKSALTFSCIYHKNMVLLKQKLSLLEFNSSDNIYLHMKNRIGEDLSANDLLNLAHRVGFKKQTYIKKNPKLLLKKIKEILINKYSRQFFPFSAKYDFSKLPREKEITFANISFPDKIRNPELQNYFLCKPFINKVFDILSKAHEKTKLALKNKNKEK